MSLLNRKECRGGPRRGPNAVRNRHGSKSAKGAMYARSRKSVFLSVCAAAMAAAGVGGHTVFVRENRLLAPRAREPTHRRLYFLIPQNSAIRWLPRRARIQLNASLKFSARDCARTQHGINKDRSSITREGRRLSYHLRRRAAASSCTRWR